MSVKPEEARKSFAGLVGTENVLTNEEALKEGEGRNRLFGKHFGVYPNPLPVAVVKVHSTEEVSKIMKYCNANGIIVIPRTGASSGEGLLEVREKDNTIILDASPMNSIIKIDAYNMVATVQCGFPLEQLENIVNKDGLTTGHFPQSLPLAHMGGLVATRSIGQFSTYYGGIEDMVVGMECVLPEGDVVRIRNVPRRAAGPDLRHIFIGHEGALGVITEVTVKLFPASPHDGWMGGFIVKNMQTGFDAIREVMVRGYKPAVVRLYDKPDIDYNFGSVTLQDEEAYMFFTAEGPEEIVKLTGEAIHKIAMEFGAKDIGTKAVEHWLVHRNDLCWKMNDPGEIEKTKQTKTIYATTEISADWSDIKKIYDDVMENVPPQLEGLVMLGGHVSHSYINGTNIYFVYRFKVSSPETAYDEHMKIVHAISKIVLKYPTGGCVHHHGMGKNRIAFAEQEHGSSYALIRGMKKWLDPNNIMCKGNLVREYGDR